jgi:beta-galactosidase
MKLMTVIAGLAISTFCFGQKASSFFDPKKMVETGVYYYPEAWDSAQWDRDLKKMADMGFEFTHVAEFAWAMIEPQEGQFDFSWLDRVLTLAQKHGLKVIMCTPSATPPVWLTQKYPETLVVNSDGLVAEHGTRTQGSWSSTKYNEKIEKVVEEMAKHFGNDKRIWGWQLDNEPSHYGTYDYNPEARTRFINWLKQKYGSIQNLNKAWGAAFWSGVYSSFDQIELPNEKRLIAGAASPHSLMDFKRFSADECARFLTLQKNTLRKYISPNQFVTTNFMNSHTDVDPWRSQDLDFPTYTMYPVAGYTNGTGDQGFRLGNWWGISFANDFFRPIKEITGVMELQPGQVNWGSYNPQPYPGAIRAWLWNAFAGNLKLICSYRFRQPLFGGEQYHYGMVGTDGVTPSVGGLEYSQFIKEIQDLRKQYDPKAKTPLSYEKRRTAILYNVDNVWNTGLQKQTNQWSYFEHMMKYYKISKSLFAPVDFISENSDFSKYRIMIVPAYELLDKELVAKLQKFADDGGHLIVTCRTGQKDRDGHLWQAPWADPITSLIGAKVKFYDVLPDSKYGDIKVGSNVFRWNNWGDVLEPLKATEIVGTYGDQFYAGQAAIVSRRAGKGSVTYIGPDTDDGKMERYIVKSVYGKIGATAPDLPEGVVADYRDGFGIAVNYGSINETFPLPDGAKVIIGKKLMVPAGVLVWKE